MGEIAQFTPEWENWVASNIGRGVAPAVLIEEMVKKGFDLASAASAVARFSTELSAVLANTGAIEPAPQYIFPIPAGFEKCYSGFARELSRIATQNLVAVDGHSVRVTARCAAPDIVALDNVLTLAECDELMALSASKLKRSTIVDDQTGSAEIIADRGSYGTYFLRAENTLVQRIERRISALLGVPEENGEGIQILRYGIGAEYKPHFDFFPPESPGSGKHLEKGGQRIATLVLYLNDVDSGGATVFPEIDFAVIPHKGSGVYFSYCDQEGRLDRLTLHAGAPVQRGEKWIATLWYRQGAY